jgi:transcriptional regulator with XRE-family HTH domain
MMNPEDFIKRLEIILDYYSINASSFADTIGVQKSSLSHLLSGRNKPSLDFILKILEVYPEVDLYWILNGKGTFPKTNKKENKIPSPSLEINPKQVESKLEKQLDVFEERTKEAILEKEDVVIATDLKSKINSQKENSSEIDRIVIFYKNGTFTTYSPE